MRITMITGGARSGKSRRAVDLAREWAGDDVAFVATARPRDEEMERRIRKHRAERPDPWQTFEPPVRPEEVIRTTGRSLVVLDCLTLLVSEVVSTASGSEEEAVAATSERISVLLDAVRSRPGRLLLVTNEVGLGLVPASPVGRWFRDALGSANRRIAAEAERVILMVSGLPVALKDKELPGSVQSGQGRTSRVLRHSRRE